MATELMFIQVSEAVSKNAFLQHIYDLKLVPVENEMTFNDLFSALKEKFKDDPERSAAVKNWVEFNKENCEDPELLDRPILTADYDEKMYAVFDFIPVK